MDWLIDRLTAWLIDWLAGHLHRLRNVEPTVVKMPQRRILAVGVFFFFVVFLFFLLHCQYRPHWAYAAERHSKIWGFIYQTKRRTSLNMCSSWELCEKFSSACAWYKHAPQKRHMWSTSHISMTLNLCSCDAAGLFSRLISCHHPSLPPQILKKKSFFVKN